MPINSLTRRKLVSSIIGGGAISTAGCFGNNKSESIKSLGRIYAEDPQKDHGEWPPATENLQEYFLKARIVTKNTPVQIEEDVYQGDFENLEYFVEDDDGEKIGSDQIGQEIFWAYSLRESWEVNREKFFDGLINSAEYLVEVRDAILQQTGEARSLEALIQFSDDMEDYTENLAKMNDYLTKNYYLLGQLQEIALFLGDITGVNDVGAAFEKFINNVQALPPQIQESLNILEETRGEPSIPKRIQFYEKISDKPGEMDWVDLGTTLFKYSPAPRDAKHWPTYGDDNLSMHSTPPGISTDIFNIGLAAHKLKVKLEEISKAAGNVANSIDDVKFETGAKAVVVMRLIEDLAEMAADAVETFVNKADNLNVYAFSFLYINAFEIYRHMIHFSFYEER